MSSIKLYRANTSIHSTKRDEVKYDGTMVRSAQLSVLDSLSSKTNSLAQEVGGEAR